MGNSLRCCLACVLPCGALDLIRIVHITGHVEEYSRPVTAKEILEANPNHVISKPSSQGVSHRIVIVSPDAELKRGDIYFLIPASALPDKMKSRKSQKRKSQKTSSTTKGHDIHATETETPTRTEEKKEGHHHRRKNGRVATWRPHLESIYED